jgi:hypothetical protein
VESGVTGQRAFFIDQSGDVIACPNGDGRYSGKGKAPEANAARQAGSTGDLGAPCAIGVAGADGQTWTVVN